MESDLQQHHHYHLHDHHQKQMNSGLTRYQSAPSSYFSSFLDRDSLEEFLDRPTSPETERIFNRFLQSSGSNSDVDSFLDQSFVEKKPTEIKKEHENQNPVPMNDETEAMMDQKQSNIVSVSQNLSHQSQSQLQNNNPLNRSSASNILRQSSSPAGIFSTTDIENAYAAVMRNMGDTGGGKNISNNGNNKETFFGTPRSRPPLSPSGLMTPISETDDKPSYPSGMSPRTLSGGLSRSSLDDSSSMFDNKLAPKTLTRGNRTLSGGLNLSETKNVDAAKCQPLAQHLSLPKSLSDIETLLESSDSVPWKIRAKRGCATHPRSIAERMRRTKISKRMKRLQDLVR